MVPVYYPIYYIVLVLLCGFRNVYFEEKNVTFEVVI